MNIEPMKRDMSRAEQTLIIKRIAVTAMIIMALLLWYQGSKPADNDPYKECWTFIVGMDGACQGDLAANALIGNGYVRSSELTETDHDVKAAVDAAMGDAEAQ